MYIFYLHSVIQYNIISTFIFVLFFSFTVIFRSRDYNKAVDGKDRENTSARVKDRAQIHHILSEVGLNPSDYIFSPLPQDSPQEEPTTSHTSAFSSYPSHPRQDNQQLLKTQSQSLFIPGRTVSYVQQPAPPLPTSQLQPPARQPPPPSNRDQAPPTSQPPINQQQGPQPPLSQRPINQQPGSQPPPSQAGPSFLSNNFNQSAPNTQNTTSQSPNNMNPNVFSPRRSPPSPPSHFNSHPDDSTLPAQHYLRQINSHDNPPVRVVKPSTQNVVYRKEIRIRYLQPPTPPPPAPIIIREKHIPPNPPQSVRIDLVLFILLQFINPFIFYL